MPKETIYQKILKVLNETPKTIEQIIIDANINQVTNDPEWYTIKNVRKGIELRTIGQILNPNEKINKYKGHSYIKI
jgi:hypothetical protein